MSISLRTTAPGVDKGGQYTPFAMKPRASPSRAERAYERVINTLQSKRFRQFMQDLVAWIQAGPWRYFGRTGEPNCA